MKLFICNWVQYLKRNNSFQEIESRLRKWKNPGLLFKADLIARVTFTINQAV